jgi:hypothetical protein
VIKVLVVVKKIPSTFLNYWFNFSVHFSIKNFINNFTDIAPATKKSDTSSPANSEPKMERQIPESLHREISRINADMEKMDKTRLSLDAQSGIQLLSKHLRILKALVQKN